ncbi:hypothetical protein JW823_08760 [bacterium]|nr:hypothetical protein [candidate division CSSED10-310 bacterium]
MKQHSFIACFLTMAIIGGTCDLSAAEIPDGFEVYFNDAQHSSTNGIDTALAAFINSANETVAGAFYSIDRSVVADAFIAAATRLGVDNVRIITDANYRGLSGCQRMEDAGLYIIDETCDGWSNDSIQVHNKFCVVDGIKVWTGSYNTTNSGSIYNNNNAVAIECEDLAEAYLTEFNEMWGGTSGPHGDCHFSTNKNTVINHHYTCNGVNLDLYFSPTKDEFPNTAYDAIMNRIDQTENSIHFCMYTFTQSNLAGKLIQVLNTGLTVRGVMDDLQAQSSYSVYDYIKSNNIDVILDDEVSPHGNLLHHKFAVFDYQSPDASVVTGSYNWTLAAQVSNDENTLFIHDQVIAEAYYNEFYKNYYGYEPGDRTPTIEITTNESSYSPGNYFLCSATLTNPGDSSVSLYEYIILDIGESFGSDRFYFWPSWSGSVDSKYLIVGPESDIEQSILQFLVPQNMPVFGPVTIWAGMLDPAGTLIGDVDSVTFSFI